jgi:hypothetical protein
LFLDSGVLLEGPFSPWSASLVSALKAAPDWFLTTNTRHFTKQVAARTQLKIVTPREFMAGIKVFG